jgi:acylphosphatase
MSELLTRRLVIRGVVQGVGYREFLRRAAEALGARGWVRNRGDGSVEALVQGPAPVVEALVAEARRGPRGGRVDSVDVEAAAAEFDGFEIRPTLR